MIFFLFPANKTRWPSGKRRWRRTNGRPPPEPDTVVLRVSGPLGRVSHSSAPFWVLNHLILPVSWLPQCGLMGGTEPLLQHLLWICTYFCTHLGSQRIIPVYNGLIFVAFASIFIAYNNMEQRHHYNTSGSRPLLLWSLMQRNVYLQPFTKAFMSLWAAHPERDFSHRNTCRKSSRRQFMRRETNV